MDKKQPEALRRSTAADGKTELFNLPGYPLMVRAVDFNRIHTESEMRRTALLDEMQKATPTAEQQAAPKAAPGDVLDEALRERDDAEDFIDALLDEVLGHERPEWSSSYGHADALNDVQERMTALHKPAVDKAWGRFQSAMAAPQQGAQEPCPTCAALARAVMLDQVSFDRKPDCYGIRQITNDEGVEEWEDIRTSPDVAREEANDMMATGRGEIYEVVPLWTTPQPAPAPLSEREEFERDWEKRHAPVPINGRTHDDGRYGDSSIQDAWESWQARAAIAAQGGKDA